MPLLTITNSLTSPLTIQDPTGLYGTVLKVPASGSLSNQVISLAALAAIEAILVKEATLNNITWSVADDPASLTDNPAHVIATATATPYNAVAGDEHILCNRGTAGAMSVVLSASAAIGHEVVVTDQKGDAGTNNITITVAGGGTINGGANLVISANNGSKRLLKRSATAWIVVD